MSQDSGLESETVKAIRRYREALALVEHLEREDACAHRALRRTLLDLPRTQRNGAAPHLKKSLFEVCSAAVARSDRMAADLVEATSRLESARLSLALLVRQLGYIPKVALRPDADETH